MPKTNPPINCQKLLIPKAEKWRPHQKLLRPEAIKWRQKKKKKEAENSEPRKRNLAISTQSCCSGSFLEKPSDSLRRIFFSEKLFEMLLDPIECDEKNCFLPLYHFRNNLSFTYINTFSKK